MPKKHQPAFLSIKPQATPPPTRAAAANPAPPQSVNERISQLRREQTPRATSQRINEVTEVVSHRTVPPQLRRLLQLAEVDAPPPKPGSRRRFRAGERPPPGPAAPGSWLAASRHAPKGVRTRHGQEAAVGRFCWLAKVHDEEFKRLPPVRSLAHHCLRTFALHWEELAEYEQHYLPTLPAALKEALLSYLSLYGHPGCLDFKSFKILFHNDAESEAASGSEEVRFLDLTGLLNKEYNLRDLEKSLQRPSSVVTRSLNDLCLGPSKSKGKAAVEVAESWEDETDDATTMPININIPFFPNLTRLSLAHPGATAPWTDLLAVSAHLNTLTHLSLAYWPRPSTTPNAVTASMVSQHTTVALGGSHFYSDLDDDWHEAANILRRFSLNTYCLKYLDLEGCSWLQALTWNLVTVGSVTASTSDNDDDAEWSSTSALPGPDWNAAWRQIEHINFSQGWIAANEKALQSVPAGIVAVQLMRYLRDDEKRKAAKHIGVLRRDVTLGEVADWLERERAMRSVLARIQCSRNLVGGKFLNADFGWATNRELSPVYTASRVMATSV